MAKEIDWTELGPFQQSMHDHADNLEDVSTFEDVEEVIVETQETLNNLTAWVNKRREEASNGTTTDAVSDKVLQRSPPKHPQGTKT